ncbi:MAG: hypothetical protein WED34_06085 [Planctomycetales bacterium]
MSNSLLRAVAVAVVMIAMSIACCSASADDIGDPQPKLTWQEFLDCQLVVVGKYQSHKDAVLTIRVERVLKGNAKAGDALDVALRHWWSVETGPVGWEAMMQEAKGDGKPRICYKAQLMNPGDLVPCAVVGPAESAIFFIPLRRDAVLVRPGQLQPPQLGDGWQQALDGKRMDLVFRLGQGVDEKLAREAREELERTRDPRILSLLVDELVETADRGHGPMRGHFHGDSARPGDLLCAIGDRKGDIYDRALRRVEPALKSSRYGAHRLAYVMGRVDPDRALKQFRVWIEAPPLPFQAGQPRPKAVDQIPELIEVDINFRKVAVHGLGSVANESAMDLCISLLPDKDVGDAALSSIRQMIGGQEVESERQRSLRIHARPRLAGTTPPPNLSKNSQDAYIWMTKNELNPNPR